MNRFHLPLYLFPAALAFILMSACSTDESPVTETEPVAAVVEVEPVVDYAVIVNTTTAADFIGRQVRLSGLKVSKVTGDKTFLVKVEDGDRAMLVYLDEQRTPETEIEGRYDVNEGDTLSLQGYVQAMPPKETLMQDWGLDETEYEQIGFQTVYIHADSLNMAG